MSEDFNRDETVVENTEVTEEVAENEPEPLSKKQQKIEKKKQKKAAKKERRENWKKDKKALRDRKKEDLKNAPLIVRLWRLYLKVPVILLIILVFFIAVFSEDIINAYEDYQMSKLYEKWETRNNEVDDKSILYEMSPLDEKGADRISKLPKYSENDTWTFCMYIVGSNLEDCDENDLSGLITTLTQTAKEEQTVKNKEMAIARRKRFGEELASNGLDYPEYLLKAYKPIASSEVVTNDVIVAEEEGCASEDLNEILAGLTSDNVRFIVQTGGATRWSNSFINPNKTQRFLITKDTFKEIESLPLQDSCNSDTLSDFLTFCNEKYKSDHMAVVFWDHGGGVNGFGSDDIFGTGLTLNDMREAFEKAVAKDEENPAYDIIGFDACLMGTVEVAHAFNGFAKYMVVSEETEPGYGWNYTSFLQMMAEDKTMNAARVSQAIADSYTDYYMTMNYNVSDLIGTNVVTMSVIDTATAEETYKAYCELNKKLLKEVVENPKKLVTISRAAAKAPVYGGYVFEWFNSIDLGVYMDYLSDYYPDECDVVRKALKEAVLYNRCNNYLSDSQGLAVYFPVALNSNGGLGNALSYTYEICEDKATAALLYYKIAGCLNEEFTEYANSIGCERIRKLNTRLFRDFDEKDVVIEDGITFSIALDSELEDLIAATKFELAKNDSDSGIIIYYGRDDCCEFDGEGNIISDFDGRWYAIEGQMLGAEIIGKTDSGYSYRARILHNDVPSYFNFSYNDETEEIALISVAPIPDEDSQDIADVGMKNTVELKPGDIIVPIYDATDLITNEEYDEYGDEIKYSDNTKLEVKKLDNGNYLQSIIISDTRGDSYYSKVVEFNVEGGEPGTAYVSEQFVGIDD